MISLCALGLAAIAPVVVQQDTSTVDTIIKMRSVVVSATRAGEVRRLSQPLAMSLIEPQMADISRGTIAADLLRDLPGVQVQQTSAGQGSVILRGMIGNQVLLLVNGIPLNNGTYRDGPGQYLATIDPETIQRIEVIRGPASVLYGSDAQGGVVNVITKSHPDAGPQSVRIAGRTMSANSSVRGRLSAGIMRSKWSLGVGASLGTAGDLRAGGDVGLQNPTGFDVAGVDADLSVSAGKHNVKAAVQHFRMTDVPRYDRYVDFRAPAPGRDSVHTFDPQTRQLAYVRYQFEPEGKAVRSLEIKASLAVQKEARNRIKLLGSGDGDSILTAWSDDVYTPGLSLVGSSEFSVGHRNLSITWGGDGYRDILDTHGSQTNINSGDVTELRRETSTGSIPTGRFPDGATADRLGLFATADVDILESLLFSFGARWAYFRNESDVGTELGGAVNNSSSNLTGQLGIVYLPDPLWSIAFRVAQGFRSPNLYDLTNVGPVPDGIVLPNTLAQPERSLSTEIGIRYLDRNGGLDFTVYLTRISNFIDRVPGSFNGDTLFQGERVYQGQNVGTARLAGFEAEGISRFGPLETRATLLYTQGNQTDSDGVETLMSKIPPLGGTVRLRWSSERGGVWVEYALRWAVEQNGLGLRDQSDPRICPQYLQDQPAFCATAGFAVHGFAAGVKVTNQVVVTAGFDNVTNRLYRTHASGVDGAGRSVWMGLSAVGVL